jgi:hypothetical protein
MAIAGTTDTKSRENEKTTQKMESAMAMWDFHIFLRK